MILPNLHTHREKRKRLAHIIAGVVILLHAYERYETGHASYLFFAASGVVFLAIAIFHHRIAKKAAWADGVFFVIEALLSFLVACEYFDAGKKALPFCYLLVGILQIFLAFAKSKKGMQHQKTIHQTIAEE